MVHSHPLKGGGEVAASTHPAAGNVAVKAVAVDVGVMCMQKLRIFEGNHIYFICSYSIFFSISYIYRLNVLFINFVFENIFPCNLTND